MVDFALEISTESIHGMVANFHKANGEVHGQIRDAVWRAGTSVHGLARAAVPIDTGRTFRAITLEFSPAGLRFKVFVNVEQYQAENLDYYPFYLEFGTRTMVARPFLFPSFRLVEPILLEDISAILRGEVVVMAGKSGKPQRPISRYPKAAGQRARRPKPTVHVSRTPFARAGRSGGRSDLADAAQLASQLRKAFRR